MQILLAIRLCSGRQNTSSYHRNKSPLLFESVLFTCFQTLLKEFNHHSCNSENVQSLIFSKSSGKRENGSGQDLSNSTSLTSLSQRSWLTPIPWTIVTTSTCSKILKLLVHNFFHCSACIDQRRHLWDQDWHSSVLGDINRWRRCNKYLGLLTRSTYSTALMCLTMGSINSNFNVVLVVVLCHYFLSYKLLL